MANKNFLLLSLEDSKIKKVSNVISNDSCRKILDYLSSREATESELAEKLELPISTVHYNLQQLLETGLISADEFHYSKKGKEVSHYRLANKYIIIAPKKTFGIKEKLKSILPVALIVSATAGIIQLVTNHLSRTGIAAQEAVVSKSAIANRAADALMAASPAPVAAEAAKTLPQNLALWFLAGSLFALIIYLIVSMLRKDMHS